MGVWVKNVSGLERRVPETFSARDAEGVVFRIQPDEEVYLEKPPLGVLAREARAGWVSMNETKKALTGEKLSEQNARIYAPLGLAPAAKVEAELFEGSQKDLEKAAASDKTDAKKDNLRVKSE